MRDGAAMVLCRVRDFDDPPPRPAHEKWLSPHTNGDSSRLIQSERLMCASVPSIGGCRSARAAVVDQRMRCGNDPPCFSQNRLSGATEAPHRFPSSEINAHGMFGFL